MMEKITNLQRASANHLAVNLSPLKALLLLIKAYRNKIPNSFNYLALSIEKEKRIQKQIAETKQFRNVVMGGLYARYLQDLLNDTGADNDKQK